MRKTMFTAHILFAVAWAGAAQAQFRNTYLDPTNGRVGYHMTVGRPYVRPSDLPRGSTPETCGAVMDNYSYSGEMPPGIEFRNTRPVEAVFTGTPRQPGNWRGTLSLEVWCERGPDQTRHSRSIAVTFTIEP